jgi:hypothetical protein
MNVERRPKRLMALAVPIVGAALLSGASGGGLHNLHLRLAQAQQPSDTPQRLRVAPAARDAILSEMRTMMRSLSLVLHGLADGNIATMEQAARRSGKTAAIDPELAKKLPPSYVKLDQRTHLRFDQLADTMKGGSANVVKQLAAITGYCVACHDMFRVDEIQ